MRQWMLRITRYADRLLAGLEKIDWSESLKENAAQLDWAQRRRGSPVSFEDETAVIPVFTTPARHFVRSHLHGSFARAQTGRCHHHPAAKSRRRRVQDKSRHQKRS